MVSIQVSSVSSNSIVRYDGKSSPSPRHVAMDTRCGSRHCDLYWSCEASAFAYGGCLLLLRIEIGIPKTSQIFSSVQPSCSITAASTAEVDTDSYFIPSSAMRISPLLKFAASVLRRAAESGSSFVGAIRTPDGRAPFAKNVVLLS